MIQIKRTCSMVDSTDAGLLTHHALADISQIAFKSNAIILKLRRRCNGPPSAAVR